MPESLARLRKPEAIKTVKEGRAATQMLPFADKLSDADIKALVDWFYTPVTPRPAWKRSADEGIAHRSSHGAAGLTRR